MATNSSASFASRDMEIPSPLGPLPATLTLPKGAGPFPVVLLVAGSGPNDRDETIGPNKPFLDVAQGLAAEGIASLRYDKRTRVYGKEIVGKSITVDDEVTDDALTALHALGQQPAIDSHRVFVVGHSLGAVMAPRIGQRDPQLAGIVLMSAAAKFDMDTIIRQARYIGAQQGASPELLNEKLAPLVQARDTLAHADAKHPPSGDFFHAPASYWLSLRDYDPVATAQGLHQPMLIMQGTNDYQVTPKDDFSRWQAAFAHDPRVKLVEYPGLGHIYMQAGNPPSPADYAKAGHVDERVIHDMAAWIKAQPASR
ncbi:alpha/beta fold hydrolase [Dyella sp. 2HG41-7]|uniref:alpha/beta hydrolase family protein n=1 Tax=Dyella sp. 2HG41-7 TaxID=2883239 RepID=UPI001F4840EA|nr:alpha/beta fold hydrolase [Dyella sp. 2HG41-7]